jgi:putative transposase
VGLGYTVQYCAYPPHETKRLVNKMHGPQPDRIELDERSREGLNELVRRHSTPQQLVLRSRIILLAAEGKNHSQIARELAVSVDMARLWRNRWFSFAGIPVEELSVRERLEDIPRPGKPSSITAEQICQIVALACEAPAKSGRPISQWTGREVADEIVKRGIVDKISPRHAQRLLKRGICNRIVSVTG